MKRSLPARAWAATLAAIVLGWWAVATWIVPLVIRAAHSGRLPLLGRLMSGRAVKPVEGYLETWAGIARNSLGVLLTATLLVAGALLLRRQARRRAAGHEPDAPPATAVGLVLIAAWIGLATGLGEAYYYMLRVFFQVKEAAGVTGVSQHAVWMSPLGNLIAFTTVGGVLVLARRLAGNRPSPRAVVVGLAWLSFLVLTMVTGRLHVAAAAILTLGLAVQTGRGLSAGAGEVAALARRSAGWMVAAVVVLGLAVPIVTMVREQRQLAAAAPAAPDAPNVLFIVLDTERAASTSLHGAARPTTPFLEQLARQGVSFERAIAPSSWTLPSHAAMFTGRRAHELGVAFNTPLDRRHPTLAEALTRRGYATAGFLSNTKYLSDLFGLDRGFGVWKDQPIVAGTVIMHSLLARTVVEAARRRMGNYQFLRRKTADAVNAEFLHWLDRREARPFFAFLNYFDPHIPYLPPEPWNLRFSETQPMYAFPGLGATAGFTAAQLAELATAYDSCIAYLDDRLERLFAELRQRGLLDNTLVVITSDHGEDLGEGAEVGHGHDLIMPLVHVPLVILHPGRVPAGVVVPEPVEIRNLAATVLSATGVGEHGLAGTSLESRWQPGAIRGAMGQAFAHFGQMAAIVSDTFELVLGPRRPDRLFNHRLDPRSLHDLSGDPAHAAVMASLQDQLKAWLAERH